MLVEKWRENRSAVLKAGEIALKAARDAGIPAYYMDPLLGPGIIKEMPDGVRHRIAVVGRDDVILETFGPRG